MAFLALRRSLLLFLMATFAGLVRGFLQSDLAGVRGFQLVALEALRVLFFVVASLAVGHPGGMGLVVKLYCALFARNIVATNVVRFFFITSLRNGKFAFQSSCP